MLCTRASGRGEGRNRGGVASGTIFKGAATDLVSQACNSARRRISQAALCLPLPTCRDSHQHTSALLPKKPSLPSQQRRTETTI